MAVVPGAGGERQGPAGLPVPGEPPAPEPKDLLEGARGVVAEPPAPAWPRAMQRSAVGACEVGTGPGAQGWMETGMRGEKNPGGIAAGGCGFQTSSHKAV